MAIKHSKVSAKTDGADTSLVRPSDWNAGHVIEDGSIATAHLADASVTAAKLAAGAANTNLFAGRRFTFVDDWMYVGPLYASVAGTIGTPLGHHTFTSQGTMDASAIGMTGTGRLGLMALSTGSATNGQCRVHTCAMGAMDAGGEANVSSLSYEAVLALSAQATVGEDFIAEVGLVGNAPGYGCFFRYQRSVGGHKWLAVTENLGTETVVTLDGTGGSVADGGTIQALSLPSFGMFRLKVVMESPDGTAASATAKFYVNGVLCATLSTNLPTHSLAGSVEIVKAAGTTPRYIALDYTCLEYVFRLDRVP